MRNSGASNTSGTYGISLATSGTKNVDIVDCIIDGFNSGIIRSGLLSDCVVNVMTGNEPAERGSEVIITSNTSFNVYIFTSGSTRANLAHSLEIWR